MTNQDKIITRDTVEEAENKEEVTEKIDLITMKEVTNKKESRNTNRSHLTKKDTKTTISNRKNTNQEGLTEETEDLEDQEVEEEAIMISTHNNIDLKQQSLESRDKKKERCKNLILIMAMKITILDIKEEPITTEENLEKNITHMISTVALEEEKSSRKMGMEKETGEVILLSTKRKEIQILSMKKSKKPLKK
jgi:hypothetical protein